MAEETNFEKSQFKSFFAYFVLVDKDSSGVLEQNEVEGGPGNFIAVLNKYFIFERGCKKYVRNWI